MKSVSMGFATHFNLTRRPRTILTQADVLETLLLPDIIVIGTNAISVGV